MKVKLVSDLHLEFSSIQIPNLENADVLILSGDIMIAEDLYDYKDFVYDPAVHGVLSNLGRRQQNSVIFRNFLKHCSKEYPHVIYIAGNHEFYNGKWVKSIKYLRDECSKYDNVNFLEQDTVIINDIVFIGATLWTNMNNQDPLTLYTTKSQMSDFSIIRNDSKNFARVTPQDTVIRHLQTLGYFKTVLEENKNKTCVVVGHHCPTAKSVHSRFIKDYQMNGAYYSELSELILNYPQIKLWTCGHTHHAHWYYVGETLVACNPRGYDTGNNPEYTGWDPSFIIDLDCMPSTDHVLKNYSIF